ncbi:MAG: peptidylprolyl isomerase [Kiloniellales bacterium]
MRKILKSLLTGIVIAGVVVTSGTENAEAGADPENHLVLELKTGSVIIELLPEVAPNHVARIKELTRQGYYDGLVFHRVMEDFMAQTGDPTGTGSGGSGQKIEAEFSSEPYLRGTLGMARSSHPDSADSQFFITLAPARFLDNNYTVWGRVIEGMEHVDQIKKAPASRSSGQVDDPDKMIRLRVQADIKD